MYDFNRKLLKVWATSIVVVAIMIVSLINSSNTSVTYSERERQLEKKQNNPLGYKDNEVVEKIIVDKGTNNYDIYDILEDKDGNHSFYIAEWENDGFVLRDVESKVAINVSLLHDRCVVIENSYETENR